MSVRLVFTGLEELKASLRSLPRDLADEAGHIVEDAAERAGQAVRTGYARHRVTGNLGDHVVVERKEAGPFGAAYVVKSTARHSHLFEHGTEARHYTTINGVSHLTGKMPPNPVFIPAVVRSRSKMYSDLRGLLLRNGLQVSGEP